MTTLQWTLPHTLLAESIAAMRPHGARGNEGLALWFGTGDECNVRFTHLVEPYGAGFFTSPLHMRLSLRSMAMLTEWAGAQKLFLGGQIHSHPASMLELSALDKAHGIRIPGYLSLVAPDYAQRTVDVHDCGVHVFENCRYRRLSPAEITQRLRIHDILLTRIRYEVHA